MKNILLFAILISSNLCFLIGQNENIIHDEKIKYSSIIENFESRYQNGPGGVVLVSKSGEILFKKAFGKANLEMDVKMKDCHVFHIASNGKPFTAIAILKLYEEGKLSLQEDIRNYIKDYPPKEHTITVAHLLTHTSGIPNITEDLDELKKITRNDYTRKEYIELFCHKPLNHMPGAKRKYSNTGYSLLGFIIEEVSGMAYHEYLNEIFFKPLEMRTTHVGDVERIIKNRVNGYDISGKEYINSEYESKIFISSGQGGILSTVEDINIWYDALFNYKILEQKTLKLALSPYKLNDGTITHSSYVWPLQSFEDSIMVGHTGITWGFASNLKYYPKEKVLAIGLLNCKSCAFENDYAFYKMMHKFPFIAMEKEFWKNDYPDEKTSKQFEGVYESENGEKRIIVFKNGMLWEQFQNKNLTKLYPMNKNYFFNEKNFDNVRFLINQKEQSITLLSTKIETKKYKKHLK